MDCPTPARTPTTAQQAGDAAESLALDRLVELGWTILARNVHVGRLELDLVAVDPGPPASLVIVEVRWRSRRDFGLAEETVDHRKRGRVRRAAFGLLERGVLTGGMMLPHLPVRFDLVVVEPGVVGEPGDGVEAGVRRREPRIRHHRAAF